MYIAIQMKNIAFSPEAKNYDKQYFDHNLLYILNFQK